ncbi:MAG: phosphoenolpyruvate carboxykinase [Rhizobiales bacterium]|nr:phosphoenolpyruvate carboxykinase [Hyphomicrobiales bacterium]
MNALNEPVIRAELAKIGLRWANCISWNAGVAELYQQALERGEARVSDGGALSVMTGAHTGRSPKDKFIVRNAAANDSVWWDNTAGLSQAQFDQIKADMLAHARLKSLFVQDLHAGADPAHRLETRVITEYAWQALFIRNLLIVPKNDLAGAPGLTILCLPSFKADPVRHGTRSDVVIAIDLAQRLVLIGGTQYAGEIKKSVFTVMNHILPEQGVLPMHCSANIGAMGDTAVFFGLSGTGKTTLSTDPERALIGDDEHGWSATGVFNIEGGCYAKAINLSAVAEPQIHAAAHRFGSVLENVILDEDHKPHFDDNSVTENTRVAYDMAAIPGAKEDGRGNIPKTIIMLTADAFGVLPPVARLTPEQAMEHFMAGYTAKVAGTERGVKEPQATFSACFGQPFLTRHPRHYGAMLKDLIATHKVACYLVNTGWTGGAYGVGKRIPIDVTRKIVRAALSGSLQDCAMRTDPHFGLAVPKLLPGVPENVLDPALGWADKAAYEATAQKLVAMFAENALRFAETGETSRHAAE